ncbi:MAG: hypothetical protein C0617_01010 [Desulfuromonas sp.]|uniref:tetratricopeptide repeat protein n=1 Tax=Desulfuromonas sp. TaxID=892 RepID=UPI000CB24EF6|nr:tetratricopeptide repeat protein [Desulfuromonas sp.]PLX86522.1 MAG: hypothetical protein C0617_01010 [Desulfuromonas sp.]
MIGADRPLGELLSDVNEMTRETSDISRGSYLITQFSVVATYLRLLVLPVNQNVDYDFPIRTDLFAPSSIFSLLLLCALLGAALYLVGFRRKAAGSYPLGDPASRLVGVGILWFFVALSVESSVIPIYDVIFEHRVYLPSAGAFLALAVGAALALRRFPARYFALLAAAATAAFGVATWNRNLVWADEVALWSDCVAKSPMNGRAYSNLGKALMAQGRYDEAIARLETAGRLSLNNVVSLNNLGSVYSRKGMVEKAIAVYRRAVEADPSYPMAHSNLGAELKKVGRADEAIAEFRKAIRLLPTYVDAYVNLGGALDLKGQSEAAARQFEKALQLNPRSPEAHSNLGVLDDRQGRLDEAIAHFQAALRDRPDYPEARANLGVSYHKQKRYDEAIEVYLQALALDPDSALFHSNLGITYLAQGRYDEAADRFRAAMKLAPDDPNYRNYLAAALKRQRARR